MGNDIIHNFLNLDIQRITELIEKYPIQVPVPVVAELLGTSPTNLRISIEQNKTDFLSISWQGSGKSNKGYAIATAPFVRKWLNIN